MRPASAGFCLSFPQSVLPCVLIRIISLIRLALCPHPPCPAGNPPSPKGKVMGRTNSKQPHPRPSPWGEGALGEGGRGRTSFRRRQRKRTGVGKSGTKVGQKWEKVGQNWDKNATKMGQIRDKTGMKSTVFCATLVSPPRAVLSSSFALPCGCPHPYYLPHPPPLAAPSPQGEGLGPGAPITFPFGEGGLPEGQDGRGKAKADFATTLDNTLDKKYYPPPKDFS